MSENENADFDPFAEDAVQDAPPAGEDDIFANADPFANGEDGDEDDIFADADFLMEEEDSGEAVRIRDAGVVYEDPLDVGLQEGMWVPLRISEVAFEPKHIPFLSPQVCLAVETLPNGKKIVYGLHKDIEEKLKQDNVVEVVREKHPMPYFVALANHEAPSFGQRKYAYQIEVPAMIIKSAAYRPQPGKNKGYPNKNGFNLRQATGATGKGDPVNAKTMPEIAKRMEDTVILARITLSTKSRTRPVKDGNGQPITILADLSSGVPQPVVVIAVPGQKTEDGSTSQPTYLLDDDSGQEWTGNPQLLVPYGAPAKGEPQAFVISDNSENAMTLMEEYAKTTDYLKMGAYLPLPDRNVTVEMIEPKVTVTQRDDAGEVIIEGGEEVVTIEGEITLETIGAIAQGNTPGTTVNVLLRNGRTVTAVWLGTKWVEFSPEKNETSGGGLDEFAGVKSL